MSWGRNPESSKLKYPTFMYFSSVTHVSVERAMAMVTTTKMASAEMMTMVLESTIQSNM